jgi:thiamine-phosphate pyrophosphorylase
MTAPQSGQLYLLTPLLSADDLGAFAPTLTSALEAGDVACVLARLAPGAEGDARRIFARLAPIAAVGGAALLADNDARLAARVGADGAHISGAGFALKEALDSLRPERIVGAGQLRTRDDAMAAGEAGADYVMFGEPGRDGLAPSAEATIERVEWWAEIFEPPCIGYASALKDVATLARAGADFVALGDAIWGAVSPLAALDEARGQLARSLA